MSSLESAFNRLPAPIIDKLQSMIGRVRRLLFIRGLCATLATALVCLLVIMAIDATFTLFSSTARWTLSLAGLGITLATTWWFLVRPLSRQLTLTHMARILEIRHPELQERISTAVELLSSDDPDSVRGSEELIGAVVESAVDDVGTVDPRSEFRPAKAAKFITASGVCLGIVLLLLAVWPRQSWTLLTRAIAPHLDIGNAWANSLTVEPGDVRIAKSSSVSIEVSVKHKRLKRAEVRRKLDDGTESVERMTLIDEAPDGTKRFSLTFPNVEEDFDYRIRAGSAVSEYYQVNTVEPPAIERLTVTYDYPEYTGLEDTTTENETGEIRAVRHTKVKVSAQLNKPAWTAKLFLGEINEMGTPEIDENLATWNFELLSGLNGTWRIELTDEEGFSNNPVEHPVTALPDKPPIVQIYNPVLRELRLKPTERLSIESTVVEDFGFTDVALLVTPQGSTEPQVIRQPLPSTSDRPGNYLSSATLDLSSLKLQEGQNRIGVQVQVRDNRPVDYEGPGAGVSETIFITLDEKAQSLADQAIESQRKQIEQQVREAKRELERARDEMRRTEQELNRSNEINERTRERLEEFSEKTSSARDKLDQVAATLNASMFQQQADKARELAQNPVSKALERAGLIPVTDNKQERLAEARQSREKIEEAIRGIDELAGEMRDAENDYRAISKLNELANRQQELAMQASEWANRDRQGAEQNPPRDEQAQKQFDQQQRRDLEQFRKQQQQVARQLGQMLKDNQAALAEVLEQERTRAEGLAGQAQALAEQQEALREINESALSEKGDTATPLTEQLLNRLEQMQSALAEATAARADAEKAVSGEETESTNTNNKAQQEFAESLAQSADQAKKAAEGLKERNLDQAKQSATEAKNSLARAATQEASSEAAPDSLESQARERSEPGTPERRPASASDLAQRQEAISNQLDAIQRGDLQEALAAMEEQLDQDAEALQSLANGFEETLQNLQQNAAKSQAGRAESLVDQGGKKASEASRQFSQAQTDQARAEEKGEVQEGELSKNTRNSMQRGEGAQEQSRNFFEQASTSLAQSSKAIGQTMEGLEPSGMDERITSSEDLARGFDEVSESAQSENSSEAAQQSRQAASSLQQLAQAAMRQLGNPSNPDQPRGQPQPPMTMGEPDTLALNESGEKTADIDGSGIPPELRDMGISAEDWARFKGALTGGNATAIETELPAEYRELVGRYFQVIAKEAAAR